MEHANREPVGPGSLDEKSFLRRNTVLLVAFIALVIVGIVTVLVPELRDDEPAKAVGAGSQAQPRTPQKK